MTNGVGVMGKMLLAVSVAAVAAISAAAPAQACWHNCHRPDRDGPWYTYAPLTNPSYFSGVTVRVYDAREYYRPRRHAYRHARPRHLHMK
jgi:hypothetical protein